MKLTASALLICGVAFVAGCSSGGTETPDAGPCKTARDCSQTPKAQVCIDGACVPTCNTSNDCTNGQVCEDGVCVNPGCGANSDCGGTQVCSGGKCAGAPTASSVAACVVTPNPAVVRSGQTVQLTVVALDASAAALPMSGGTWAATGSATVDSAGKVTGGASAGTATVTATIGGKSCDAAVKVYASNSAGLRALVIDAHTKLPIVGAKVVLDSATSTAATTDADGLATFASATGAHDVHVFAKDYNYASYIGVSGNNVLATLTPYVKLARRSGFTSTWTGADFTPLNKKGEILHLAFFGSGIPNSILDFSIDTLLGPMRQVTINIGGSNKVDLPSGLVIGLADDLFGTGTVKIYAEPGKRALWGIGGNIAFDAAFAAIGPLLSSTSTPDVGALLPQLLPLLGDLQAGSIVGAQAPANVAEGGTPTFTSLKVPLDTPLRLRAQATVPTLPKVDGKYVDGVIALAGAAAYPMGFTPLGFSAAITAKDGSGNNTGAVNDPTCDPKTASCATSKIPFKLAARNHGLEVFPYGMVLLALNFGGLTPGSNNGIAVSGLVQTKDEVKFTKDTEAAVPVTYARGFPALHGSGQVAYSKAQRKITVAADAEATTQVYRFEIENAARQSWAVWMPPAGGSARNVTLPDPSVFGAGYIDPAADAVPQGGTVAAAASARMLGIITTDSGANYAGLTGFGSVTLDAIGNNLAAFSMLTVNLGN